MKVWIVFRSYCGDPPDVEKVFLTESDAQDYVDQQETQRFRSHWVESFDVETGADPAIVG